MNATASTQRPIFFAFVLGFVGFVTSFGAHIVAVNLPVYAQQVGAGVAMIGVLIAAYDLAEIIAKPIFGVIADRHGMKRTMMLGIVVFTVASLVYLVVPPLLLLLVRFLQGVGAAALSAVSLALIGVYYRANRGRAYGIYNVIKGAGYVLSPIVGGLLVLNSGFATIFLASAAIGLVSLLLSLVLPSVAVDHAVALDDDDDFSPAAFTSVFRDPRLLRWYAVIVVNMFFVSILFGFVPVRIHALNVDPFTSGLLLSAVAVSYLLIQPLAGWVADRTDVAGTIRVGLILAGLGIILVAFVDGLALLLVSVIAGIGVGIVWTNSDTLVSEMAAAGKLGATMGAAGSFKELGDMVGPIAIGLLSQGLGLTAGFVICGVVGLSTVLLVGTPATRVLTDGADAAGRT